jgi:hypothetical protein
MLPLLPTIENSYNNSHETKYLSIKRTFSEPTNYKYSVYVPRSQIMKQIRPKSVVSKTIEELEMELFKQVLPTPVLSTIVHDTVNNIIN